MEMGMLESQLEKYFGFSSFNQGQKEVVSKIASHGSAAAIFPTGAGKSLCYQLSALLLPHMTLVVSPLLALMKDQIDFLEKHGIPAARLDSTLSRDEYNAILDKAGKGELKILMISVERFGNERFRSRLQRMNISLMVVDEAHCISEWGHNFRPEYLKLPVYQKEFKIPQVLLLTATATGRVVDEMCAKFGIPKENVVSTGFYRSNLFLQITPTPESQKKARLLQRIRQSPTAPTIVYVTLQKTAEDVAGFLCENNIHAAAYHAGMTNEDREQIQNRFMQGQLDCIAATIAFGMGIDKNDIRRVIHYDLPKTIENYSQEIGRSGRDGKPSLCEVLANTEHVHVLENFIYGDTPARSEIFMLLDKLQHVPERHWEIRLTSLSHEVNIRLLPLKTLLVYLELEGVIRPKYIYFADYAFKLKDEPDRIIERFEAERKAFVSAIFDHCRAGRTWTHVDIEAVTQNYRTDRQRVVAALEYFDEKGWIELESKQAVQVYEITDCHFDPDTVAEKMHLLFQCRQAREIQRIHDMVRFFQSDACISKQLAKYFGEDLENSRCGHCSFCETGKADLPEKPELPTLSTFDVEALTAAFRETAGEHGSVLNAAKFLCGISCPLFTKLRIKNLPHFGALQGYSFLDVQNLTARANCLHVAGCANGR